MTVDLKRKKEGKKRGEREEGKEGRGEEEEKVQK